MAEIIFVADPILNGKPVKLCKNGSDIFFSFFFCVCVQFIKVAAAAFRTACK